MAINSTNPTGGNFQTHSTHNTAPLGGKPQTSSTKSAPGPQGNFSWKEMFKAFNSMNTLKDLHNIIQKAQQEQAQVQHFLNTAYSECRNRGLDVDKLMQHARSRPGFQPIPFHPEQAHQILQKQLAEFDRRIALPENKGADPTKVMAEIDDEFAAHDAGASQHVPQNQPNKIQQEISNLQQKLNAILEELEMDLNETPVQQKPFVKAYRELSLKHHPDKGGNEESFKALKNLHDDMKELSQKGGTLFDTQAKQVFAKHYEANKANPEALKVINEYFEAAAKKMEKTS